MVSEDGKKVRRAHPLPEVDLEEIQVSVFLYLSTLEISAKMKRAHYLSSNASSSFSVCKTMFTIVSDAVYIIFLLFCFPHDLC